MATKCCKAPSAKCIQKSPTEADCKPSCPKAGPCVVLTDTLDFGSHERASTFWFPVYVEDN
eukprot:9301968-Lingulodinium_polyedra.AAC.1